MDDSAEPPQLDDFGFWSVTGPDDAEGLDRLFDECSMVVNFRVLPLAGGWRDQPQDFTEDFKTWLALVSRAKWEADPKHGSSSGKNFDDDPHAFMSWLTDDSGPGFRGDAPDVWAIVNEE